MRRALSLRGSLLSSAIMLRFAANKRSGINGPARSLASPTPAQVKYTERISALLRDWNVKPLGSKRDLHDDAEEGDAKRPVRVCATPGCDSIALKKWCEEHKQYQMCRYEGCERQAHFNIPGAGAQWCSTHKDEHMENTIGRRCPCGKLAAYGYKKRTHCAKCRTAEMGNLVSPICACGTVACFGKPGSRKTHCVTCRLPGMKDLRNDYCIHGRQGKCLGDICGVKIGSRSLEEMFASASAYILLSGHDNDTDVFTGYINSIDSVLKTPDGRRFHPDMVISSDIIFEYDGFHWHREKVERDTENTRAALAMGFTRVIRVRDSLPSIDVDGCQNIHVNSKKGTEAMCEQIARELGFDGDLRALWIKIDSLARRAILHLGQRYAKTKQTPITAHFTPVQKEP